MKIEVSKEKNDKKIEEFEIEQWAHTIQEAEKIKADPEKLALAKKFMQDKLKNMKKTISSIEDLKAVRQEKAQETDMIDDDEEDEELS